MQQNEKPKLFYATMAFPYGLGEKSFVMPELQYLSSKFDVTIVSGASQSQFEDIENLTVLDPAIQIIRIDYSNISIIQKAFMGFWALFHQNVRRELKEIIAEKKHIMERCYQSMAFYLYAQEFCKVVKRKKYIEEDKTAIFYSYWYNVQTMGAVLLKKKFPLLQVVTRTHGFDLYNERISGGRQPFKKMMDKELAAIFFICEEGKRYYINHFMAGVDNKKYIVAPIGTIRNESKTRKINIVDNMLRIMSCSSLIPLKRVDLIIDALSVLPEKYNVSWIHFGDGSERRQLEKYALEKLGVKKNIEYLFYGNVQNGQIHQYYQNHQVDAFISTSSTEGLPVSMQEALSYGIPLIATDVGGVGELIDNSGILLSSNPDAREIADAIGYFIDLGEKRKEQSINAFEMWKKRYNADTNVRFFTQKLECLMGNSKNE